MTQFNRSATLFPMIVLLAAVLLPMLRAAGTEPASTMEVIGRGVGISRDSALRDSLRNAVHIAVGAFVDARTLIQNDRVVEDRILTHSNAFVQSYELVSDAKREPDGLYQVTILAVVKQSELISEIRASNIAVRPISGRDKWAEVITQEERVSTGTELVRTLFEGMPHSLLRADVGELEYDRGTGTANVEIRLSIDQSAYQTFSSKAIEALDAVAMNSHVVTTSRAVRYGDGAFWRYEFPTSALPEAMYSDKAHRIMIAEQVSGDMSSSRWRVYETEPRIIHALSEQLRPVVVMVALTAEDASIIDVQYINLDQERVVSNFTQEVDTWKTRNPAALLLTNTWAKNGQAQMRRHNRAIAQIVMPGASTAIVYKLDFAIDAEQLRNVSNVVCVVQDR